MTKQVRDSVSHVAGLSTFEVTVRGRGRVRLNSYSPAFAAMQAQNSLLTARERSDPWFVPRYTLCWVRPVQGKRTGRSEAVRPYNGFGR
jgi:hypothetical protein